MDWDFAAKTLEIATSLQKAPAFLDAIRSSMFIPGMNGGVFITPDENEEIVWATSGDVTAVALMYKKPKASVFVTISNEDLVYSADLSDSTLRHLAHVIATWTFKFPEWIPVQFKTPSVMSFADLYDEVAASWEELPPGSPEEAAQVLLFELFCAITSDDDSL